MVCGECSSSRLHLNGALNGHSFDALLCQLNRRYIHRPTGASGNFPLIPKYYLNIYLVKF